MADILYASDLAGVQQVGGKFRSFLLTAVKNFLTNEWQRNQTQKRGGGKLSLSLDELDAAARYQIEPTDETSPEILFERRWAATLLEQAQQRLRAEYVEAGKADLFVRLQPCLTGAEPSRPYAELATQLGMTEAAVKMAVHRLRKHYGEALRAEIAQTVASPNEISEELRHLLAVLSG